MPPPAFPADGAFPAGTRIAVERFGHGVTDIQVDDLTVGDQIVVQTRGDATTRKLRRIDRRHFADPPPGATVRIAAGALGAGIPRRDLVLPAEALVLIRDLPTPALVPAGALANGGSVNAAASSPSAAAAAANAGIWFTLELDAHDVLLAEGAPVTSRRAAPLCAPVLPPGPTLAAIRRRLAQPTPPPPAPPPEPLAPPAPIQPAPPPADPTRPLRIHADAGELATTADGTPHTYIAALPPGTGRLRLLSPSAPSRAPGDGRRLGVCIVEITLDGAPLALDADGPGAVAGPGFHPVEPDAEGRRWTNGDAWLQLPHSAAARTLRLRTNDWHVGLIPD